MTERKCDACGRLITGEYATDDEVCGGTDGPGFFLCLDACNEVRDLDVQARRHHYAMQRMRNDGVRYVFGSLANGDFKQHLTTSTTPPQEARLGDGEHRIRFVAPGQSGLYWKVSRGRVVEFTAPYGGQRCIAREVTDPALVAEVDRVEAAVEAAKAALAAAHEQRQEVLAVVAARCKPARVSR